MEAEERDPDEASGSGAFNASVPRRRKVFLFVLLLKMNMEPDIGFPKQNSRYAVLPDK